MNINPESMLKKRLENAISNSNYQDMVIALPVAVEYKVSPKIIKKVSQKISEYYFEEKEYDHSFK